MQNNQHIRFHGYPKVKEIRTSSVEKVDLNDPNFYKPLNHIERDYNEQPKGILIFKIR